MRLFGMQKTRRMLYTGEPIDAQEALRLGGIESVVPREKLRDEAMALARTIAGKSPKALRLAKWSLNGIELLDPKESYRYEQGFTLELYTSRDSQEARDAFVEKREASFESGKKKDEKKQ
jgi:enoyl-CoA hydratase